jgi:hypothetical protein
METGGGNRLEGNNRGNRLDANRRKPARWKPEETGSKETSKMK